jgi:type II secretory pathway component PulF
MPDLTQQDQDRLLRELASLIRTGIPLPEGLRRLSQSLAQGQLQRTSAELADALNKGKSLSQALRDASPGPSPQFVALVECAELSGDTRSILEFALEHSRRVQRHRAALITTLVYPFFLLATTVTVFCFVLVVIVPKLKDIFDQIGAELPWLTELAIEMSYHISHGPVAVLLLALLVVLAGACLFAPFRNRLYDILGRLPGFRPLADLSDTALLMKCIERMAGHAVPMPAILQTARLAMWQEASRRAVGVMAAAAQQGHPIGPMLGKNVPATAAWLFCQAEEKGDLPAACGGIAEYCEDRFDRLSRRATAILEPLLILLVALFVAFLIASVYLPLFQIPRIIGASS